jgi:hypothetical protein
MKPVIIFFIICATALTTFAQNNTVTINYKGQNRQVWVDGTAYDPNTANNQYDAINTSTAGGNNNTIVITNLATGRHTLEIRKNNNNRKNSATAFNLRKNYDMLISVANDGSVQLKETKRTNTGTSVRTPMSNASFNLILQDVRQRAGTNAKINVLNAAFANANNYFTSSQVRQLISLVSGEAPRLQLAKASVRGITDQRNFTVLNTLFGLQASRNELAAYVNDFNNGQIGTGTSPSTYRTPMADASFEMLFNDIRNRWQPGAKMNALSNTFAISNNYFTTTQAIQLIQLVSGESERLQLAKASYRTIVDPAAFTRVYDLLGTQAARNDLANYVRNGGVGYEGNQSTSYKTPMADADFNSLFDNTRSLWLPGAKKSAVMNAFANTNNYFTTYQAAQLVQLDNDESDRMDMARASLRSITDPGNIVLLYNVFATQARRDELAAYVRSYNSGSTTGTGNTSYRTAMPDANFATLLDQTKRMWLPGAKKAAVLNAFAGGNYFTTLQARQLIALDNDEPDRLDMAKAAYKTLVDPQNFSQVYTLFANQSYINDLANFARNGGQ